jgi:membrane-associated phospholipid phosphatase
MSAFFLYGLLAFTMKSNTAKFFLFCVAALIGFSRVYLACHFPMDVTAGAFIGTLVGMTAYLVFHYESTISD